MDQLWGAEFPLGHVGPARQAKPDKELLPAERKLMMRVTILGLPKCTWKATIVHSAFAFDLGLQKVAVRCDIEGAACMLHCDAPAAAPSFNARWLTWPDTKPLSNQAHWDGHANTLRTDIVV